MTAKVCENDGKPATQTVQAWGSGGYHDMLLCDECAKRYRDKIIMKEMLKEKSA
jgi:hypothetical protein